MAVTDLMSLAHDKGFRLRVTFALFDVARDKAPTAATDDLAFVNGILNGEPDIQNMVTAVVVVNADPETADDASIKTTVESVWSFFAKAWVARTL